MKSYWDHTEKERSEMTEERISSFIDIELMEKGVLKVEKPELRIEEAMPEVEKETWYQCCGLLFDTVEKAEALLALKPKKSDYDYKIGSDYLYVDNVSGMEIMHIQIIPKEKFDEILYRLKEVKVNKKYNEAALAEYNGRVKLVDNTVSDLWGDWNRCGDLAYEFARIMKTHDDYLKLCDGIEKIANEFLLKVYTPQQIIDCEKWFNDDNS